MGADGTSPWPPSQGGFSRVDVLEILRAALDDNGLLPMALRTPVPILIPVVEGFFERFRKGDGLEDERLGGADVAGTGDPTAGKGQVVALPDGVQVHFLVGDAALHHGHGGHEAGKLVEHIAGEGSRQMLVASQRGEPEHGLHIRIGVVLRGGCPPADDALYGEGLALAVEVFPVALQHFPRGTVAVGHRLELYEATVFLLHPCTLPTVGRVADVERIVVTDSSAFHC